MAERIYATDRKPRARCPELLGKRCSRPSLIGNAVSLERRTYHRVGDTGFEPVTSTMSTWRSNQLS